MTTSRIDSKYDPYETVRTLLEKIANDVLESKEGKAYESFLQKQALLRAKEDVIAILEEEGSDLEEELSQSNVLAEPAKKPGRKKANKPYSITEELLYDTIASQIARTNLEAIIKCLATQTVLPQLSLSSNAFIIELLHTQLTQIPCKLIRPLPNKLSDHPDQQIYKLWLICHVVKSHKMLRERIEKLKLAPSQSASLRSSSLFSPTLTQSAPTSSSAKIENPPTKTNHFKKPKQKISASMQHAMQHRKKESESRAGFFKRKVRSFLTTVQEEGKEKWNLLFGKKD